MSLACLVKGRSSSSSINGLLQGSIPDHVYYNNKAFYGYVRSKKNPADGPTRDRGVPPPVKNAAGWLRSAELGDFGEMDEFLAEQGMDREAVRGLPPERELWEPCDVDVRTCSQRRRAM